MSGVCTWTKHCITSYKEMHKWNTKMLSGRLKKQLILWQDWPSGYNQGRWPDIWEAKHDLFWDDHAKYGFFQVKRTLLHFVYSHDNYKSTFSHKQSLFVHKRYSVGANISCLFTTKVHSISPTLQVSYFQEGNMTDS